MTDQRSKPLEDQLRSAIAKARRSAMLLLVPGGSLFLGGYALMLGGHVWPGVCAFDFGALLIAIWAYRPLDRG